MQAEIQIWRNRLEKEFDFYQQISDEYDQCTDECQRLEAELVMSSDDILEKQYTNAYHRKAVALKRLSDLSTILENYLNEYNKLCQQKDQHEQTLQKIKQLPVWKQQTHVDLSPADAIKHYDGPIKFSDMTFEDFMRDYVVRFKEHREAYDEIMKKGTQPPPPKKEPYDPRVPLKKEVPEPQKPDNATIRKLKQTLRDNNAKGVITTWNPYKDERAKQQQELTTKIIHAREAALKKARDNARAIGRDLAKREYEFRKALEAAKQAAKLERAAPADNAWKFLQKSTTSGDPAAAAATQYVPLDAQPYLSKQMPHVPTKSFGLAIPGGETAKKDKIINEILNHKGVSMETLLKNRETAYETTLQDGADELDVLGGGKLDLGLPGIGSPKPKGSKSPSRPTSRAKTKVPDKGKDKKKDAAPAATDDQWLVSESDEPDDEPQLNVKWRKVPNPSTRPAPIIRQNNVTGQFEGFKKCQELGKSLRFDESGAHRVPRPADAIPKQIDRIDKNGRVYSETIMVQPDDSRFSSVKMSENASEFFDQTNQQTNQSLTLSQMKTTGKQLTKQSLSFNGSLKNLQTLKKINWSGTIRDDVADGLKTSRVRNTLTPSVYKGSRESRFVADPEVLNYYDVVEGQAYTLNLRVTNASASTQSFKLLDIEEKNRDNFEIKYTRPGEMAPGNSCKLQIIFKYQNAKQPLVDHIHTKISFQTQDGILDVPIHCYILMPNIFVRPNDRRDVDKLSEKLFSDTRLNNETHDEQIQQHMNFHTLVAGVNKQFLYILNAGSATQQMTFKMNKINQYEILTSKVMEETDQKIEEYDKQHEQLIADIQADYKLYDEFVKAGKKGKKPALKYDYEASEIDSEEKLQEFINAEIDKQLGSRPEKLDQQQVTYSQLAQINTNLDDIQTFINYNFSHMHLLTYQKKPFDQQAYKQQIYEELSAQAKEKSREIILQQLNEKKAEEEAALKKSKKQPEGDSLLIEEYFNAQLEEKSLEHYEKECENIKQELQGPKVISERLLQLQFDKQQNNTEITFSIPRESIISLPIIHNPATTDFEKLQIQAELEMKSPVDGTIKTYYFEHNFNCSDSPIQIIESDLDMLTCFYTQQYNQLFTVKLLDKNDAVTRKVNVNIPEGLKQCVRVDQSLIIMNQKLNEAHIKLSATIPSKEFLYNLLSQQNEDWSNINVEFNKFSDTVEGLELGTDMTDMVNSLEESNKQLKEQQDQHVRLNQQKETLKQQIEDLKPQLEPDPKTGKPNPKAQKAEQQMEELQNQLEQILGQIDATQTEISRLQDDIMETTGKLNTTDFVGSYNTLTFCLQVVVQDQPSKLYLPVKMDMTTCEIESDIESQQIKFRNMRPGHLTGFPIKILNKSAVAQHVTAQIVSAKKLDNDVEVALVPFGGVRLLLPGETGLINLMLSPRFEGSQGQFQLKVMSEFGFSEALRNVTFKALEKQQNVLKIQKQIKTVSINDELKIPISIKNVSDSLINYSVCQSFIDFVQKIDPQLLQIEPTTFALAPGAKRDVEITISMKEKQFNALNEFLKQQTVYQEVNFGAFQYLTSRAHHRHITMQLPILTSKNMTEVASFNFFITDPHVTVSLVRDQFTDRAQSPASRSPSRGTGAPAPKSAKGTPARKGAPQPPPEQTQLQAEDLTKETSSNYKNRIVVDLGCVPVGGLSTRKVKLDALENFITFEEFIPRFDADIELLTHLHGIEVKRQKELVLRFTPKKSGEQQETFQIGCYTNKNKDTQLNCVEITAKGLGVKVDIDISIPGQASTPLLAGSGDAPAAGKDKGAKGAAPEPPAEPGKPIDHFLKPFKPGEVQRVKIDLKNLNTDYFYDVQIRETASNPNFSVNILRKQIYIQAQPESAEIAIQSLQETTQLEKLQFNVKTGDQEQIINIFCFTISDLGFIRHQDDIYACNNTSAPINLEIGTDKFTVQPTKYERIKPGIVQQDGIIVNTIK